MSRSLGKTLGLDRAAVGYGLRLALAAWLAFSIAASLHVEHAFWAAMPIWVVAQSSRGLLLERAVLRVIGTLIGAAAGFGILHVPVPLTAQLVLLAVWVAVSAALTHILRGVHSYGALLAGMTAGVVVIPSLLQPAHSLALAVARVECTLIGVVVVTLVTGLFTPTSRRQAFYAHVRKLAGDAVAFAAVAVKGGSVEDGDRLERRILAEISDVDASARMVSAGSVEGYRLLKHVDSLIASSLAVMAAGRALRARSRRGEATPEALPETLNRLASRLHAPPEAREIVGAAEGIRALGPEVARLADDVERLVAAETALFAAPEEAAARSFGKKSAYLAPHRDWLLARNTGLLCGGATFLMTDVALISAWPPGTLAALSVCIFSMVLGSMPQPQLIAPKLFTGVLAGAVVAVGYRLLLQPRLDSTVAIVLSLVPFFVVGGLARASTRTAIPALDANMCFMLASQAGMPAIAASQVLDDTAAMVLGASLMSMSFVALPRRFNRYAEDAAGFIRQDLRRLITSEAPEHPEAWRARTSRQILRLMLHLGRAGELGKAAPPGLLAALNLGHAVAALREAIANPDLPHSARQAAKEAVQSLLRFEDDPEGVASALAPLAEAAGEGPVSRAILDAADALRGAASLLAFGRVQD